MQATNNTSDMKKTLFILCIVAASCTKEKSVEQIENNNCGIVISTRGKIFVVLYHDLTEVAYGMGTETIVPGQKYCKPR